MGWQNSKGEINYTDLKIFMQDEIVRDVETENPAALSLLKQMMVGSIEECERFPPVYDINHDNHGRIVVKVQNCIINNFHEVMKEYVYLLTNIL